MPARFLAAAEQLRNTLKGYSPGTVAIHSLKHLAGGWKLTLVSLSHHLQVLEWICQPQDTSNRDQCRDRAQKRGRSTHTHIGMWGNPDHRALLCSWEEQRNAMSSADLLLGHGHVVGFGKSCIVGRRRDNMLSNQRKEDY